MNNIKAIIRSQREFFKTGKTRDYNFRIKTLKKLKTCIKKHEKEIYKALILDLNKSKFESFVGEIGFVLKEIDFTIKHLEKWTTPKKVSTGIVNFPAKSFIYSQPYGVVLIMSPWNYPFHLSIMPLIGAISAANTAILKPSEISQHTSNLIEKMMSRCFNPSYIAVINGAKEIAQKLLDERFDKIFYTGNSSVGKIVMEKAAKYLTPVCLELGGKSPAIILKDTNLNLAAKRIVWGKFFNAGQTCVSVDYIAVEKEVYDKFTEILIKETKKYTSMKNFEENYSKIIDDRHFDRLTSIIGKSKILYSKGYIKDKLLIYPTIIEAEEDSSIMEDEIFGPLLPVVEFDNYEDIKEFVISRPKPLALYFFTESRNMKRKILNEIPSGGVTINDTIVHLSSNYLPFGGIGESGMGSYHGIYSFYEFSQKRAVMDRSTTIDIPLRYPPYKGKLPIVKKLF